MRELRKRKTRKKIELACGCPESCDTTVDVSLRKRSINGVDMSYKIISPKNGPSYPWLLNDYKPESTVEEAIFNRNLNDIRGYGDTVISRLRSRFPILCQMLDLSYKVVPQVIGACCVIHNICEVNDDPFFEEWLLEADAMLRKYPQPDINFT
ncbi:unnamed protein product, partial [Trichogramma brassicae]